MAHCQNVAELLDYMDSTSRAIETSRALAAKDKKKLQKSCRAECELHMRRLTQSGVPGTSSGPSSNVGTSIGAEEHMEHVLLALQLSRAVAARAAKRSGGVGEGAGVGVGVGGRGADIRTVRYICMVACGSASPARKRTRLTKVEGLFCRLLFFADFCFFCRIFFRFERFRTRLKLQFFPPSLRACSPPRLLTPPRRPWQRILRRTP